MYRGKPKFILSTSREHTIKRRNKRILKIIYIILATYAIIDVFILIVRNLF